MLTSKFKLPPLEGDDVAMLMERDMLRRWGFLGQQQQQQQGQKGVKVKVTDTGKTKNGGASAQSDSDSNKGSGEDSDVSIDDGDDDNNEEDEDENERENNINYDTMPDMEKHSPERSENAAESKDDNDDNEGQKNEAKDDKATDQIMRSENGQEKNSKNDNDEDGDNNDENGDENDNDGDNNDKGGNENGNESFKRKDDEEEEECDDQKMENEKKNDTDWKDGITSSAQNDGVQKPPSISTESKKKEEKQEKTSKQEMFGDVLRLFQEAGRYYDEDDFCECMLSVEEAIELSGADGDDGCDVDVTQLWLLRAKVMNSMENYKEALKSAYKVKAKERPSRLWVEGAIAMEKLGIQVTAEMWIAMGMHRWKDENEVAPEVTSGDGELWDAAVDSDVMCLLKMMQSRLRIERIYGAMAADKPIKVKASLKYNKTIHALRRIKKGEIIFQEVPDIFEQTIHTHRITACAECAKSLLQPEDLITKSAANKTPNLIADIRKGLRKIWPKQKVFNCSFCREVKYCSDDCRKKSWDNHHKVICPSKAESTAAMLYDVRRSFRDVMAADGSTWQGWWNTEFSPTLLSRMIAIVLCKANLLADLRARENYSDAHWSMCEAILEKYSPCDKMNAADQVPKMLELLNSVFKRSKFLRYDLTKDAFNKLYSQALTNVIKFHDTSHPMNNFAQRIKSENEKLYKKIRKNNENSLEKSTLAEFHGLFPLASCLNHSCYPNAVVESAPVENKPGISVRAVRDVREGDEILVAYVEPQMERHERRKILWKKYKFVCECPRCLHQGIGPHVCTNCGKTARTTTEPNTKHPASSDVTSERSSSTHNAAAVELSEPSTEPSKQEVTSVESTEDSSMTLNTNEDDNCVTNVQNENENNKDNNHESDVDDKIDDDAGKPTTTLSDEVSNFNLKSTEDNNTIVVTNTNCQAPNPGGSKTENELLGTDKINAADCVDESKSEPKLEPKSEPKSELLGTDENLNAAESKSEPKSEPNSENSAIKFSACGRCKKAWYCSVECQKDSWTNGHKRICNAPQ